MFCLFFFYLFHNKPFWNNPFENFFVCYIVSPAYLLKLLFERHYYSLLFFWNNLCFTFVQQNATHTCFWYICLMLKLHFLSKKLNFLFNIEVGSVNLVCKFMFIPSIWTYLSAFHVPKIICLFYNPISFLILSLFFCVFCLITSLVTWINIKYDLILNLI